MTYFIFLKSLRSLEEFRKNPHIKIPPTNFQSLGIFKNQILFGKEFFPSLSAQPRPIFFLFNRPFFSPLPLGLGLSADPSCPLGPADRASVAPCQIAASHTGKRLTSCHLRPSPFLADRWAPPIITFLRCRPSSTPRCRLVEPPWLPCPPPCPLSLWPTVTTP
jgi:hypothetical protein